MNHVIAAVALVLAGLNGTAAQAAQKVLEAPDALKKLTACRTLSGEAERLRCYDSEVASIEAAQARSELVVLDRKQLNKTRRTLFGLSLPDLSIFGDGNSDDEAVTAIESKIKSVQPFGHGKWIFELQDGARWVQVDSKELALPPRPGQDIKIRKAALGSYFANVNKQTAIRVQRQR